MIPILSEIVELNGLSIWKTSDHVIGTGFEILPCDIETENSEDYFSKILNLVRSLDPSILSRIHMRASRSKDSVDCGVRSDSLKAIGSTQRSLFLYVQVKTEPILVKKLKSLFQNSSADIGFESLLKVHSIVVDSGLTAKPISKTAAEELFMNPPVQWSKQSNHLSI